MAEFECYCGRCTGDVPCWASGDHNYHGAICSDCGDRNMALLYWERIEKADKQGRHHGNHFHNSTEKADACPRKTHDEAECANRGGCFHHDPSQAYFDVLDSAAASAVA